MAGVLCSATQPHLNGVLLDAARGRGPDEALAASVQRGSMRRDYWARVERLGMALRPSNRPRPLSMASGMARSGRPMSDTVKGEQWTPGAVGVERVNIDARRQLQEEAAAVNEKAARAKSRAWTVTVWACRRQAARPP